MLVNVSRRSDKKDRFICCAYYCLNILGFKNGGKGTLYAENDQINYTNCAKI
jgi:hypothetical protein